MNSQSLTPREQKIRLIVAMSWLILLMGVTGYFLIAQPYPVFWLIRSVSDEGGYYSPKLVGGIVFITIAILTFPLTLLAGKLLDRILHAKRN